MLGGLINRRIDEERKLLQCLLVSEPALLVLTHEGKSTAFNG